jgi:tetratricopeptide (TPR) repeat protein
MSQTILRASLLLGLGVISCEMLLTAQQQPQKRDPPQGQESSSRKPGQPDQTTDDSGQPASPATKPGSKVGADVPAKSDANTKYDPFPAVHDMDVGTFYLHKGDTDAAIDRFLDAIKLRPNYALPRLLLGQAYEKKGDTASALKYYKEYLEVFPNAPDAKKVRKKIEQLAKK